MMQRPRLVGMIHLPALPGTPAWDGMGYEEKIGDVWSRIDHLAPIVEVEPEDQFAEEEQVNVA